MASPIQTVIGKDTSNPLIAEGLLKILKEIKCACFAKNFLHSKYSRPYESQFRSGNFEGGLVDGKKYL